MDNNETKLEDVILEEVLTTPDSTPVEVVVVEEEISVEKNSKIKAIWLAVKNFVGGHVRIVTTVATVVVILVLAYIFKGQFLAASVNGELISRHTVISELESASGKAALNSLITEKLVGQAAKNKNISIGDDEVNSEIKKIEDSVKAQGGTLAEALAAQGMTMEALRKQIVINKELEKLLADKVSVADSEVDKYIADNKITLTKGQETAEKAQIKESLRQQKMSAEASTFIDSLRAAAKIKYFVNY